MLYCVGIRFSNWSYVYCFLNKNIGLHSNIIQLKFKKIFLTDTHIMKLNQIFSQYVFPGFCAVYINELNFFVRN